MATPPSTPHPVANVVLRAWQQAILALDDVRAGQDVVQQTLDDWQMFYDDAIKDTSDPVFQRLLQRNIHRTKFRLAMSHLLPDLLARLIPPRVEPLTPGPLETLQLPTDAGPWYELPEGRALLREVLRLLPSSQRQAFWLLSVERLPLRLAARALARSRYGVRKDAARATAMLATILALKDAVAETDERQQVVGQALQALAGWQAELATQAGPVLTAPAPGRRKLPRWRLLPLRHPLATRLAGLALLGSLALGGVWLQQWRSASDPAELDVQILSGEVPLGILLDPHFAEASHD
ncbi:hypothetical protein THUN1379_23800 [Paludibacterium sp. THUN1379]|uniref:hypothetical protein n=1 Tax=Paludibacterium sp. THUN1379 TaxID=3112107 RepID=UPI0030884F63|nr:hypothetical protein THUN1379_23800 [Paludibacterium sp. THUN1379]